MNVRWLTWSVGPGKRCRPIARQHSNGSLRLFLLHVWDLSEMAEMTNQNTNVVRGKANASNYSSVMGKHQLTDSPSLPDEKLVVLQQSGSFTPGLITRLVCPMAFTEEGYGSGFCRTSRGGGRWQQVRCPWKNCEWEEDKRMRRRAGTG